MADLLIPLRLEDLPESLRRFGRQIPFATARALNDTAFGLMREEKTKLDTNLTLRNKWTQSGERVQKASKRNLSASVGNTRWYMETLAGGGERRARIGISYKSRRYLLVPADGMKTKAGKLKKLKNKPFVFENNNGIFLAYRKGNKRLPVQVVGRLVLETEYDENTYPFRAVAENYIRQNLLENWKEAMEYAARTAR